MFEPLEEFRKKNSYNKDIPVSFLKNKAAQKKNSTAVGTFNDVIDEKAEENFNQNIDEFISNLSVLEQNLLRKPSEQSVREYKTSISLFLKKMSTNFKSFQFYTRKKHEKVMKVIYQVVDKDLNEIYKKVVSGNLQGLMLLDKLKEIKGLIIDLKR